MRLALKVDRCEVARYDARARRVARANAAAGYTLVELLFVIALLAIVAAVAIPQISAGVERARTRAAARYVAGKLGLARTQAVVRAATVAVRFEAATAGTALSLVVDGNGNGVRTADIDAGVDRVVERPARLEEAFPGVSFALASDPNADGVQLGGSRLLSFTPDGTSTTGSLYLLGRDRSQYAIRILGATGRVRTQRLDARTNSWVDVL